MLKYIVTRSQIFLALLCASSLAFANTASPESVAASPSAPTSSPLEVRKIKPPGLEAVHFKKRILCHRPMRKETPAMFVEKLGDKWVAHNYGHGGSGWTLAPGAAQYVIASLHKELRQQKITKKEPILVIGAGALGLMSALELVKLGYSKITIIANNFDNIPSYQAGGLLTASSMDNNPESKPLIDKISRESFKFYKDIAQGKNKQFTNGAKILPAYCISREKSGLESYVGDLMQPAKDVMVDFQNNTTRPMVVYDDAIFMDAGVLMASFKRALDKRVTIKRGTVDDIQNVSQKVVVNCSGIGAKTLVKDDKMVSVQGHLILLKNQNPDELDYMLVANLRVGKTLDGMDIKRFTMFLPKQIPGSPANEKGVLGNTLIIDSDETHPHPEEFEAVIEGAREFFGIKAAESNPKSS